jgi:hypothetical protein
VRQVGKSHIRYIGTNARLNRRKLLKYPANGAAGSLMKSERLLLLTIGTPASCQYATYAYRFAIPLLLRERGAQEKIELVIW